MLENLEKIDWGSVQHCNGPANNIPKLLQDLLSKDKKTQSSAILQLFDNIWHHGTVYEASAQAVPFLYEILESPSCFERFSVVWLLGAIANGTSEPPVNHSEKNEEMIWAKNAHGAVRLGVKTILGLLDEKDMDLRLPVVLLLASLSEEAAQITPVLSSMLLTEKNAEARAGFGLALALLGVFRVEAFRSESTLLPFLLIETLAKACMQDETMKASVYLTIEECFLATMEKKDKDWLFDEKALLESPPHLNIN